ncbi:MAG: DUF3791 domain-containing protein [Bacteroidales bacterium]|nr:DUF3791 domain-containing protein [Bacteroidales bacterium]
MPEHIISLPQLDIELGFAASCIEGMAREMNCSYRDVVARMKRTGMLKNFILPYYEQLHTESREHVTEIAMDYLKKEEAKS